MSRKFSSVSLETEVVGSLTTVATSLDVVSATNLLGGINDADVSASNDFIIVIDPETSSEEIVKVTAVSGNTLTITRGHDGSTAKTHSSGAKVRHMAIGEDLRLAAAHRAATGAVHGVSGTIVGTTDTQTLTNKTISGAANTLSNIPNSATTATSANTASAIVARDASGNFSAGTVTAALSGNASTATTLATGRTFQIVGDVEASGQTFNGSANVTLTTSIGTGVIVNNDVNASAGIAYSKLNLNQSITSADIVDGTLTNADINASAGIDKTKISGTAITAADTGTVTNAMLAGSIDTSKILNFDSEVQQNRLDQMALPTATVSLNNQKLEDLADPTETHGAVTVSYLNSQKSVANGIASLDGSGKIPQSELPALAIAETFVVASEAAMLALTAQTGDIAVRTDVNKSFILTTSPASTLANWQELLTPTDSVLSVDGNTGAIDLTGTYLNKSGDTMSGDLNMGTNNVTNLASPTNSGDAANKGYVDSILGSATDAAASAAAAAASYDSFDDRYLGAKAVPPTLDNDGNALVTGALYWDSVANQMFAWDGSAWGSISSTAEIYRYRFVASGGETSLSGLDALSQTLSYLPGKEQVYLNGVLLIRTTDYTATDGVSITALSALTAGDVVEIITFTAFDLATAITTSSINAKGDLLAGSAADTVGTLAVGTDGQVLTADSSTATGLAWAEGLPSQTGNSGKYLSTDGSTASWESVDALPSQTGNDGKYLSTDGSTASWETIVTDPTPTVFMLMGA